MGKHSQLPEIQIKPDEISTGVTLEESQRRAQHIYETVVKPQVEEDRKLTDEQKKITLTAEQQILSNIHSPY